MLADMSESPSEAPTGPVASSPPTPPPAYVAPPPPQTRQPSPLTQVAAWVGITAGVVFIVAVVFGTGFMLGVHSGGRGGGPVRHHQDYSFERVGPPGMFPMRPMPPFGGPGGPGGPGLQPPQPPGAPAAPGAPTTTAPARP